MFEHRRPAAWFFISGLVAATLSLAQVQVQTPVQVSGTVMDPSGKPVAGARVEITAQGLVATTDATGKFLLARASTMVKGNLEVTQSKSAWKNGSLSLFLDDDAEVPVEAYSLEGRRLRAPWLGGPVAPLLRPTPATAARAKAAADGDTLTLVALGYQREDRPLPLLSGIQDFKLKAVSHANVPYKTGAGLSAYEIERCNLDVHIPASAAGKKLPVVLHFHGGGLHGGDKNEGWFDGDNWFSRKLMEEGLIIFSANYRLGQDPDLAKNSKHVVYPEYLRDAASAVAWLAVMLAVDTSHYQAVGFRPGDLNGYLAWSSQTYTYGQIAVERGISDRSVSTGALFHYVRKHDIPMALFVGGNEGQRISDMQAWHKQMMDAGSTRMTLSVQAGRDHKQLVTIMGNAVDDTRAKTMAFIRQYSR